LRSLIDVCRNEKISTIFLQEEFNTRNIGLIRRETKTKPHRINPLAYDWEKEMLNITNILANE
jgi:zinc transport system substrate-binding protein